VIVPDHDLIMPKWFISECLILIGEHPAPRNKGDSAEVMYREDTAAILTGRVVEWEGGIGSIVTRQQSGHQCIGR
jgi:hypothetical protein